MTELYLLAFLLAILWLLARLLAQPREGVLCGLVATSMCPEALPVSMVDGIGLAAQLGFFTLSVFYLLLRGRFRGRYVGNLYNVLLVLFGVLMLAYIYVSTAKGYGISKTSLFFLKSVLPVFLLSAMAPFSERELRLGFYALVGASLLAALSLFASGTFGAERATAGEINAISVSRSIGCGAALLIGVVITGRGDRNRYILFATALFGFCLVGMVATGSRGPLGALVGGVIALVIAVPMSLRKRFRALGKFALFVGTVIAGTLYYGVGSILRQMGGLQRIILRTSQFGTGASDRGRLHRFSVAVDEFLQSGGLGIGTGEYLRVYPYDSGAAREYPHNLFFEAAVEQGVLGLSVVLVMMLAVALKFYRTSMRYKKNDYIKILYILFVFSFLNAMVSGDVPMNSILWISGGLLWVVLESESERLAGAPS